jgi:flagellar motor switch protein FliN/FliY
LAAALKPQAQSIPAAQNSSPTSSPPSASYRRLMDVGLDVKLRFGTRRMLLRDVLALSAGIVVELDTHLHSPVDLLLDGKLIAQGEVVVVDGKYGLRITDVVDPAPAAGVAG